MRQHEPHVVRGKMMHLEELIKIILLQIANHTSTVAGKDDAWIDSFTQETVTEQSSPKSESSKLSYFTNWSEWSVCDRHCSQNRVRRCMTKSQCGTTVLRVSVNVIEVVIITIKIFIIFDRKNVLANTREKDEEKDVSNVNVEDDGNQINFTWYSCQRKPHLGTVEEEVPMSKINLTITMANGADGLRVQGYVLPSVTGKWCRKPGICGRDVIRESAYCYVEGSFCQRWIHRKIRGSREEDNDDVILDEFELNPNSVDSFIPEKVQPAWKCGMVNPQKNSRLSYFTRIIGGRPTVPGAWPWQVAVLNRFHEAFCGGTLVSPKWVLTAAHCIRKRLYVRIGEHDLTVKEGTELELRVDSVVIHPEYDADTVDNDVAMLRLPVNLTPSPSRGIACLPAPKQLLPTNQLCTILGWGKSRVTDDFGTDILHEVKIPIVSSEICRKVYVDYRITDNMFCAGYRRGKMDSCAGDSGGPLLCRDPRRPDHGWTIFGITSFGEGCGKRGKFGIYAKLPNYVKWISRVMKQDDERD
ncbi:hypothetical protein M0804_011548 [Polistes exclamans]|nr:hypothetical protein M0804_011548 [Polistes exclamans]